ncbi:acyltransferase [Bacillus sp. T3]|uniref:acyltransferase family protein n=1 Tax=Bacillus sp. T3 TaxID=467262 RepID=UPI0029821BCD|nr:acyltransferase [Bacillus sp. T3]
MNGRYEELDSLRGLAALSVFLGHIYLIFNSNLYSNLLFEFGPFRFIIAGSEAVTLFFVLSGFVLAIPFFGNKEIHYGTYIVKRICRIYLPYLIAILIAFTTRELFYSGEINRLSNWFNMNWTRTIDINTILKHMFLIGTFTSNFNNVVWSLVHEMRISIIFPILMFLVVRLNLKKSILLSITLSILSVIYSIITKANFFGTELYVSVHYSSIFVFGALLAKYREDLINLFQKISLRIRIIILIIGLTLYLYAHPSFLINMLINDFNPFYRTVIDTWFTSLGSGILIIIAIASKRFSLLLRNKLINFMGKISYSLYLSHLIVLFSTVHFLYGHAPLWIIISMVVLITFILSTILYYIIEKPSIEIGKYLTRSIFTPSKVERSTSLHSKNTMDSQI